MAFNPTPWQDKAIHAKGNTLVSAAAGSGKTAVLVERVIEKLTDRENPVSADRLLIVTYTNAAALELRTRIEQRFEQVYSEDRDNVFLAKQKQMLGSASICTIDSFCIDLVRENFQKAGVSPDFKISDGTSLREVDERVADRIIGDLFAASDPAFYTLLDIIGTEYDEKNLRNTVLDLYNFSRQLPDPDAWFRSISAPYQGGFFTSSAAEWCFRFAESHALEISKFLAAIKEWMDEESALEAHLRDRFALAEPAVRALLAAVKEKDWDGVFSAANELKDNGFPAAGRVKSVYKNLAGAAWGEMTKNAGDLAKLFYDTKEHIEEQFRYLAAPFALLSDILLRFETELLKEYLRRNTLTFHNTEHLAYALLKADDGELLDRFEEVMVDEYQDVNDLQDAIFSLLSGGERLFAVGDVKQSIYGFRGANPKNFLTKSRNAVEYGTAKPGQIQRLILAENFRSHPDVCHAVNFFFSLLMTGSQDGLVYNEKEALAPAAKYPDAPLDRVCFDLIDYKANVDRLRAAEGKHIAEKIREIMAMPPCIRVDETTLRKAEYSDFAILLRTVDGKTAELAAALRKEGIPVNLRTGEYASSLEIETFTALLKIIDNPDSDIDLLTVLASPIFGFTDEELAKLRIGNREGTLYSVMIAAGQENAHADLFLRRIAQYRRLAVVLPLPTLISRLLYLTDYLNTVSAMEGGEKRRSNLLLLTTLAESYTADHDGDIKGFVRYVQKQSDSGLRPGLSVGNTVRIMTIHSSKGLQFPVCFLAGVSTQFNTNDLSGSIVYSATGGVGIRYLDEAAAKKRTTPIREIICEEMRLRGKEEEQRLLYVALTRAQDQLIVTYTVKNLDKLLASQNELLTLFDGRVDRACKHADCSGKWLLTAALRHPDGKMLRETGGNLIPVDTDKHIRITVTDGALSETPAVEPEKEEREPDAALVARLKENMKYVYPYASLLTMEAKASVTAIANKAERAKFAFSDRPAFMSEGDITVTERGTAMHKIMQFFDFQKTDAIEEEIERLYEWQYISEREKDSINRKALKIFFESPLFARIGRAEKTVQREMRFLTEIPAGRIDPTLSVEAAKEGIMVQGAVDLCFEEEDGIVILDFKTDRVKDPEELKNAYKEQLAIYALACEKIFERPVKQKILYSFALGKAIEV